jgi:hypothetical protein
MSWNIDLICLFKEKKHPIFRILEITDLLKNDSYLSYLRLLSIYESLEDISPSVQLPLDATVDTSNLSGLLNPYQEMIDTRLEGVAIAKQRYFYDSESAGLVKNGYKVFVSLPARSASGKMLDADRSLKYSVGPARMFSTQVDEAAASMNFSEVLCEVTSLSKLGIQHITATSAEDDDIKNCFFVYHDEPSGYLHDVYHNINPDSPLFGLLNKDIQAIARESKYVQSIEIGRGIAIYNTNLIEGNLRGFFSNLKRYLDSQF